MLKILIPSPKNLQLYLVHGFFVFICKTNPTGHLCPSWHVVPVKPHKECKEWGLVWHGIKKSHMEEGAATVFGSVGGLCCREIWGGRQILRWTWLQLWYFIKGDRSTNRFDTVSFFDLFSLQWITEFSEILQITASNWTSN